MIFELTEDALYHTSPQALAAIAQLRLAGHGITLDDVAQRQSGLLRLSHLPVTEIKIDLERLRQAREWDKARSIFTSIADLGHRLALIVVAEGVEISTTLRWRGAPAWTTFKAISSRESGPSRNCSPCGPCPAAPASPGLSRCRE